MGIEMDNEKRIITDTRIRYSNKAERRKAERPKIERRKRSTTTTKKREVVKFCDTQGR
jgi:hypothetical protein